MARSLPAGMRFGTSRQAERTGGYRQGNLLGERPLLGVSGRSVERWCGFPVVVETGMAASVWFGIVTRLERLDRD
jgi:hypothetical protein